MIGHPSLTIYITSSILFFSRQPGVVRTKEKTRKTLSLFFNEAKTLYSKTRLAKLRTDTGIKDTFQQFFLDQLPSSYKNKQDKQKALDEAIRALPDDITSPIWRLGRSDLPHKSPPRLTS